MPVESTFIEMAKDLPSTGMLLLFIVVVNKQFGVALELIRQHLAEVHRLLERCITNEEINEKLERYRDRITDLEHLLNDAEIRVKLSKETG